jgi:DNA-binding transcriptional LysR family regulator
VHIHFPWKPMEFYQIRYFLAVSRTLNFTQAAEECNVTQPALTRAIKKLEDELGGELFRRERSRSHLTDLGHAMMPLLQQSYDAAIAAKAEAENYGRGDVAPLAIGISESVTGAVLAAVIAELARAVAGLNLTIERAPATDIRARLEAGDIDFGIVAESDEPWERERLWPLFDEGFVVCAGGNGATGKPVRTADLGGWAAIDRPYCENRDAFEVLFGVASTGPDYRHRATCEADTALLAAAGLGITMMPRSSAQAVGATFAELEAGAPRRTIALIAAAGRRQSEAGTRFLRLMRSADWSAFGD